MANNKETINNKLEAFLTAPERHYNPETFDSAGNKTVASEAEVFRFRFVKDGVDYGPVTISIDGLNQIVVYYGDKVAKSPTASTDGSESWHKFLKSLAYWAHSHNLEIEQADEINLRSDMEKRAHKQKMNEGYYPINKKTSYSDNIPTVTMRIQHSRDMMEGEQRFRNINKIFFETQEGERILSPTNKPGLARVFARHLAEGGKNNDDRWNHITGLCEEYSKMAGFVRATRNGQFNESAQRLISEGINHYQSLRESLHKLSGHKGYNTYFESWTPALMENEEQVDLSEMFMTSSLDPRIESVMPILGKLSKNISETTIKQVDELAEWVDSIIEGEQEISKMDKSQPSSDRGGESSGNPYAKGGKATPVKPGEVAKKGAKALDKAMNKSHPDYNKHEKKLISKMSNDEKKDKGWRNPNMEEGLEEEVDTGQYDAVKSTPKGKQDDDVFKKFREKVRKYGDELGQRQSEKKEKEVDEGLDAQQKQAGQLGPTEKVINNNQGKLVGTSESVDPLLRLKDLLGK